MGRERSWKKSIEMSAAGGITIPLHRNEVKSSMRCKGSLRPVSATVIRLQVIYEGSTVV
jgi:hypothetical protein